MKERIKLLQKYLNISQTGIWDNITKKAYQKSISGIKLNNPTEITPNFDKIQKINPFTEKDKLEIKSILADLSKDINKLNSGSNVL
jgi:hypothetical protein